MIKWIICKHSKPLNPFEKLTRYLSVNFTIYKEVRISLDCSKFFKTVFFDFYILTSLLQIFPLFFTHWALIRFILLAWNYHRAYPIEARPHTPFSVFEWCLLLFSKLYIKIQILFLINDYESLFDACKESDLEFIVSPVNFESEENQCHELYKHKY